MNKVDDKNKIITYLFLRRLLYEALVFLWVFRKGSTRVITLVSGCLKIVPYGFLKTRTVGLYKIFLDPGDANDLHYYFNKVGHGYRKLLRKILTDGDMVIDVGANVGYFSALACHFVGENGCVHAIDASPDMIKRLELMQASFLGGPLKIHHCALWGVSGFAKFNIATNSGWSSLKKNPTFTTYSEVDVQLQTLDDFTLKNRVKHVKLLKLDIEGAEYDALKGGKFFLKNQVCDYILFEAEPHRLKAYQKSIVEIFNLLHQAGYCCIALIIQDKVLFIQDDVAAKIYKNCDYLFVRNSVYKSALKLIF